MFSQPQVTVLLLMRRSMTLPLFMHTRATLRRIT